MLGIRIHLNFKEQCVGQTQEVLSTRFGACKDMNCMQSSGLQPNVHLGACMDDSIKDLKSRAAYILANHDLNIMLV